MTDYDSILLKSRRNELEAIARRHTDWMEARRALAQDHGRDSQRASRSSVLSGLRTLLGLRSSARRGLKGRRSLI